MTWMGKAAGFAATIAAFVVLAAPAGAQDVLRQGVVAIVNDNVISSYDVGERIRLILATSGIQVTEQNRNQIEQEAVNELIDEHLEMQEVRRAEKDQKFKIVADDADVADRIDEIAKQTFKMSGPQFIAALQTANVNPDTLRDQIRTQMSWERWMMGRYGGSRLKVSQAQIAAAIAEREAAAAQPQYLVGEIYIDAAQAGGMPQAEATAQQLVQQLVQGASFPAVARQFSAASTAATGGDAGWLSASELPPEVQSVIDQLRPGELSKPIETQTGVYIVLVRDKHAGATSELVTLKQAAISLTADAPPAQVAAAQQKLMALRADVSCDNIVARGSKVDGVIAADLGESDIKDLKAEFRDAAVKLSVGQVSEPIRTSAGLHLIALCGRREAGVDIPSPDEMEGRIREQEMTLISKRQLRDLRNSATIEFP
jgi:peptidyl-prolyl cis-trans isomerase SurA